MASSLDLFPRQTGGRVAELAGLLRRVLQPVALSAVLQDEPPQVDGVPEGLAQRVGDWDQLWHRFLRTTLEMNYRISATYTTARLTRLSGISWRAAASSHQVPAQAGTHVVRRTTATRMGKDRPNSGCRVQ